MTQTPEESAANQPVSVEPTGHDLIDAALQRLERLDDVAIMDHPQEFEAIHQVLRDSLAAAGGDGDGPDPA